MGRLVQVGRLAASAAVDSMGGDYLCPLRERVLAGFGEAKGDGARGGFALWEAWVRIGQGCDSCH